jgi:hypothetical protein
VPSRTRRQYQRTLRPRRARGRSTHSRAHHSGRVADVHRSRCGLRQTNQPVVCARLRRLSAKRRDLRRATALHCHFALAASYGLEAVGKSRLYQLSDEAVQPRKAVTHEPPPRLWGRHPLPGTLPPKCPKSMVAETWLKRTSHNRCHRLKTTVRLSRPQAYFNSWPSLYTQGSCVPRERGRPSWGRAQRPRGL